MQRVFAINRCCLYNKFNNFMCGFRLPLQYTNIIINRIDRKLDRRVHKIKFIAAGRS